ELEALAAELGEEAGHELAPARAEIEALQVRVTRDPLGAEAGLESGLTRRLRGVRDRLEAAARQRDEARAPPARAPGPLQGIHAAQPAAQAAFDRRRREIEDPPDIVPPDAALVDGLASWLDTLEATVDRGRWRAAQVGLSRWLKEAERCLTSARNAHTA